MKKVFFLCMTVGLLATACDWFKSKPETQETVDVAVDTLNTTVTTIDDSTVQKTDSTVAVIETKTETTKK